MVVRNERLRFCVTRDVIQNMVHFVSIGRLGWIFEYPAIDGLNLIDSRSFD